MIKEKDLLKTFGIETPKKDQLFRIVWVEKTRSHVGEVRRTLKEAEKFLHKVLSSTHYRIEPLQDGGIQVYWANHVFEGCDSTTELRNSYVIPVEE